MTTPPPLPLSPPPPVSLDQSDTQKAHEDKSKLAVSLSLSPASETDRFLYKGFTQPDIKEALPFGERDTLTFGEELGYTWSPSTYSTSIVDIKTDKGLRNVNPAHNVLAEVFGLDTRFHQPEHSTPSTDALSINTSRMSSEAIMCATESVEIVEADLLDTPDTRWNGVQKGEGGFTGSAFAMLSTRKKRRNVFETEEGDPIGLFVADGPNKRSIEIKIVVSPLPTPNG